MASPNIIGSTTNNKIYTTTDSGANRSFDVAVPAGANTVAVLCGLDGNESGGFEMQSITISGLTGASVVLDTKASTADDIRASRFGVIDVSQCGAGTMAVQVNFSGSSTSGAVLGVVCTDGFIESSTLFVDRSLDFAHIATHSANNDNNLLIVLGIMDGGTADFSFSGTGHAELFRTDHGSASIGAVAATQSTTSADKYKRILMTDTPTGDEFTGVALVVSSQSDPFDGITGGMTKSIVK
tara:strand:+ start:521 stop:1240 length:720 start_codon:yes stop_codon:yes gene_type:complete